MLLDTLIKITNYKSPKSFKYGTSEIKKSKYFNLKFLMQKESFILQKDLMNDYHAKKIAEIYEHGSGSAEPNSMNALRRNTKSSISIEMSEEDLKVLSPKNREDLIKSYEKARDYLFLQDIITPKILSKIYYLISNNEQHINSETNEKLDGKMFRQTPIYIGGTENKILPKDIYAELDKFCSSLMSAIFKQNTEKTCNKDYDLWFPPVALGITHFIFEHIHPFPDFNGRIGRLLIEWFLSKIDFPYPNINMSILSTKDSYYKALKWTEETNDLTYIALYFSHICTIQPEIEIINTISINNKLSEKQQSILINLFLNDFKLSAKRYGKAFNDSREYVSIQKDFQHLNKLDFLEFETGKANLKTYYISKTLNAQINKNEKREIKYLI